jgi:YegS/Rv2252/BmrU family lipid kinase
MPKSPEKVFVVFNPKAGKEGQADAVKAALEIHFGWPRWELEVYETTGKEDLAAICRNACDDGAVMVVAAGGDGTVTGVASGLVDGQVPMGILPLGTGNDLARILGLPLKLEDALDVLVGDHVLLEMDALKVGKNTYLSNVSSGITPVAMKETDSKEKKRFGRLAYLWTVLQKSSLFHLRRYRVTVDGQTHFVYASEVMISNVPLLNTPPNLFGPPETLQDGQLEVYLITASTVTDFMKMAWDMILHPDNSAKETHIEAKRSVRIETGGSAQLVQADGEVIGKTPVEVTLLPRALTVIMPKATAEKHPVQAEPVKSKAQ